MTFCVFAFVMVVVMMLGVVVGRVGDGERGGRDGRRGALCSQEGHRRHGANGLSSAA